MYNVMLKKTPSPNYKDIKNVVLQFIMHWFKERGMGHFQAINQILQILMLNEDDNIGNELETLEPLEPLKQLEALNEYDGRIIEKNQKQKHEYIFAYYYNKDKQMINRQ